MANEFTVTSITERLVPMAAGGFGRLVQVTYRTPRGYVGTVDLPKDEATPETVRRLVMADVNRINALYTL